MTTEQTQQMTTSEVTIEQPIVVQEAVKMPDRFTSLIHTAYSEMAQEIVAILSKKYKFDFTEACAMLTTYEPASPKVKKVKAPKEPKEPKEAKEVKEKVVKEPKEVKEKVVKEPKEVKEKVVKEKVVKVVVTEEEKQKIKEEKEKQKEEEKEKLKEEKKKQKEEEKEKLKEEKKKQKEEEKKKQKEPVDGEVVEPKKKGRKPDPNKPPKAEKGAKGRPKKEDKAVNIEGADGDDLFAALAKQADQEAKQMTADDIVVIAEEVAEAVAEEVAEAPPIVKKIEFKGKKYLMSKDTGVIYDYTALKDNNEAIVLGKWNKSKQQIDFEVEDELEMEELENDEDRVE